MHRYTCVAQEDAVGTSTIAQVHVDAEGTNDREATFTADTAFITEEGNPILNLIDPATTTA